MADELFLGIDGGGTHCRARLTDAHGTVLAEAEAGSANIYTSLPTAAVSIAEAATDTLSRAGLPASARSRIRAGLGVAGGNSPEEARGLAEWPFGFRGQTVGSDAEIACLGAHAGRDGAILILGTGSQGLVKTGDRFETVGGWGFHISDTGSGAILGRRAIRRALEAHEGLSATSDFTRKMVEKLGGSPAAMLRFALDARPRDYAAVAPDIFAAAGAGDPVAHAVLMQSVAEVEILIARLVDLGAGRLVLMGGLAGPYLPYLSAIARERLVAPDGDALSGALLLAGLARQETDHV